MRLWKIFDQRELGHEYVEATSVPLSHDLHEAGSGLQTNLKASRESRRALDERNSE
jgi:hypothetical protein